MTTALFIGRFQPFHNGHLDIVKKILQENKKIIIIIGSAEKSFEKHNPLTAKERKELIEETLKAENISNYEILDVADINDFKNWTEYIKKLSPPFDKLYTGSQLVKDCFNGKYGKAILKNKDIIHIEKNINISATKVRKALTQNKNWQDSVPKTVASKLKLWDIKNRLKNLKSKILMNKNIFRAYDIRGFAEEIDGNPADLTEKTVYLIGKGAGTYLQRKYNSKNIAVGRDCRLTGPMLQNAYINGLRDTGMNVTDISLCISPMMYWASCAMDFDAGTNITASHNPKEYNGLKIVAKNAHSICGNELQDLYKIIEDEDFIEAETPGELDAQDIWPAYLKELNSKVKIDRPLKIVVDAGNGTAGPFAPEFLRKIGCEVIELFCDPDGNFPNHEANPEELENMQDLIAKVLEEKADLGIGFDGDGDRVGIVDEKGHMYSSDFMLLLLTRDLVNRIPNPKVVFDVKVSQIIINEMERLGATTIMSKTGHSFIESKMKEVNAPLAGEVSGHLFFGENYYGFDDALLAAGKIVEIISKSELPLSQMFDDLPKSYTTPEFKAHCPDDKKFEIVKKLVEHFTANYDCITIDGVRVKFDELAWAAVRASNTSPNLTLRFEAKTPEQLKEIQKIMADEIKKHPDVSLDWYKN